jgi:hypothetical protein
MNTLGFSYWRSFSRVATLLRMGGPLFAQPVRHPAAHTPVCRLELYWSAGRLMMLIFTWHQKKHQWVGRSQRNLLTLNRLMLGLRAPLHRVLTHPTPVIPRWVPSARLPGTRPVRPRLHSGTLRLPLTISMSPVYRVHALHFLRLFLTWRRKVGAVVYPHRSLAGPLRIKRILGYTSVR